MNSEENNVNDVSQNLFRIDLKQSGITLVETGSVIMTETVFRLSREFSRKRDARLTHVTVAALPVQVMGNLIPLAEARKLMKRKKSISTLGKWCTSEEIAPLIGAVKIDGEWHVDKQLFQSYLEKINSK